MNGRDAQNAVWALYGVIVRPGATLCRISDNPGTYLVPSVGIFAAASVLTVLFPSGYGGYPMWGGLHDDTAYALIIGSVMGLLPIMGIFGVGRWWGGNRSFRRAFSALAYCLVPGMLGVVAVTTAAGIYHPAIPESVFSDGSIMMPEHNLSLLTIWFVAGLFFVGWTFLLQVKAIRILNGFGYARSVAILVLAMLIVYAANLTHGTFTATNLKPAI